MTHAFLQSELTSLISESKRRYNDVRTAAEQSLNDLKAIAVTSETQLAGDLLRRPQFIDPFVLACKSKNAKLVIIGTSCLHRLTASKAVNQGRLPELLDALHDGVASGYEPQLKILQTLPSLLQLYGRDLHGDLLARAVEICAALQSSKTSVVSNTAAATFQQLVSTVFDHAGEDGNTRRSTDSNSKNGAEDGETPNLFSDDAMCLLNDFCLLLDQQQAQFLKLESLSSALLLETVQMIFSTHASFLASNLAHLHGDMEHLLQGLLRILGKKDAFGDVVRTVSIVFLILQNFAEDLRTNLQPLLSLLVEGLEKDSNPLWKRTLCLEFFRNVCSDFVIFRNTFELFDGQKKSNKVIGQFMSALVRIAAEDPSLIGLGRQSTMPVQRTNDARSEEAASIEAQGLGGAITSVSTGDSNTTGISMEWSLPSSALMDQPEKHNAPAIPSTYIYSLVLGCIASFCDGISKFVMPVSVPSRSVQREATETIQRDGPGRETVDSGTNGTSNRPSAVASKYQRLINPLTLTQHPGLHEIQTCAAMIETCWPAALATCSTFLNSALDAEFYHTLIRSIQKLAQVSGVLELSTPRDALLTTLAKASIPTNASSIISNSQHSRSARNMGPEQDDLHDEVKPPTEAPPTPTFQVTTSPLNVRHLLCLRALLNLGIALGPTLEEDAWFIVIESMQTVDALTAIPSAGVATAQTTNDRTVRSSSDGQATLAGEIASVQAATKRMFESTRTYNQESFSTVVQALFRLLGDRGSLTDSQSVEEVVASPVSPTRSGPPRSPYRVTRTVSALWTKSNSLDLEIGFVLGKISEISRINISRFASVSEQSCSWDLIGKRLLHILQDSGFSGTHRVQSASILDLVAIETMKLLDDPGLDAKEANTMRLRCLQSLLEQLESLDRNSGNKTDAVGLEIHKRLLEALESILSDSGDALDSAWSTTLTILSRTFLKRGQGSVKSDITSLDHDESDEHNAQILRVAFRSIQLITSDFLGALTASSLSSLAPLLRQFGSQSYDLNVALTSTTLLWSLASHILTIIESIELTKMPASHTELEDSSHPPASDTLWSITLLQLVALCKDERSDVRNAAIRVLLKMLEASSESLSANAWSVTLIVGPLNAIRHCVQRCLSHEAEHSDWLASATQLTDGTVQLMCQHLAVIFKHEGFKDTWLRILDVFEDLLGLSSLSASALAFTNLSRLLTSLQALEEEKEDFVTPVLQLWASNHPAETLQSIHPSEGLGEAETVPNQPAVAAHMRTFIEADKTSAEAVAKFQLDGRGISSLLMDSIERTILSCTHPAYTSDVKSLAGEQQEACNALSILKRLLDGETPQYSRYLLRLVKRSLSIQAGKVAAQTKKSAIHKTVQKPTFIAFASACLDSLKGLMLEHVNDANLLHTLSVQESFETLSALVRTKYTDLPTNNQAPLWRSATVTAVVMLEAVQQHLRQKTSSEELAQLGNLPDAIITMASTVLQPGGLVNTTSKHSEDTLLEDENFDVEHFQLFHAAVISVFQHDSVDLTACRQYAIILFKASLLAKPWFLDLPNDLEAEPLKHLLKVRPGSLHPPVFAVRRRTCYAALDALFELVQRPEHGSSHIGTDKLAHAACPYLLLRVVHPLKTFLADQRLRGLTPPPLPQQVELQTILAKFVELRSNDGAFRDLAEGGGADDQQGDGQEHLRILYSFILRVQKFWRELPRLKSEGAWQADDPGKGIEKALDEWSMRIGQTWSAGLES